MPKTYIKTYNLSKWIPEPEITKWCYQNNFSTGRKADAGISGIMHTTLTKQLRVEEGHLIIAHDGNKNVGWALTYDIKLGRYKNEIQIYVPPRHRRKGIGTKLLKRVIQLRGKVRVYPHEQNEGFYESFGLTENETVTGRCFKNV